MNSSHELYPRMNPGRGIVFFFCMFIAMFFILSFVSAVLMAKTGNQTAMIRISAVLQDVFVFMLPAVVTAIFMTRLPARFLFIENLPRLWPLMLGVAILYASIPWIECVIQWNKSIGFPDSMKGVEQTLREMESAAEEMVGGMLKGGSVVSLIASICIVGVLAGLSEELFFRGAMLRLFVMTRINYHVAIWAVALIFSFLHFQLFGFVPRLLLGAYFGYLAWRSKCLWIPIIAHMLNNSTVVVSEWLERENGETVGLAATFNPDWTIVTASLILTVIGLCLFWKATGNER